MIALSISRVQLDSLETDPCFAGRFDLRCESCQKAISIKIVLLGSQPDRNLTSRQASPIAWHVNRLSMLAEMIKHPLDGIFHLGSGARVVRVRLNPERIFQLRKHFPLICSAQCPHCQTPLDITLQPA